MRGRDVAYVPPKDAPVSIGGAHAKQTVRLLAIAPVPHRALYGLAGVTVPHAKDATVDSEHLLRMHKGHLNRHYEMTEVVEPGRASFASET